MRHLITKLLCSILLIFCATAQASRPPLLLEELRGKPAPGALLIGKVALGSEVFLDGKPLAVQADGHFVFGFGRDDSGSKELLIRRGDFTESRPLKLVARQWNIQRVEGVPQRTVEPPPETLARIREEAAQARAARAQKTNQSHFLEDFIWPSSGRVSGVYGSQRFYNGQPGSPHFGIDIAAPTGEPVVAPAGGVVTLAHDDMFYSGGTLVIDHGWGVFSTFLHLSQLHVQVGDRVQQGDRIADIGATGRATGPHLDWRLNWFHERLDPQWFMEGIGLQQVRSVFGQKN